MLSVLLLAGASVGFVAFSNSRFGMKGFSASPVIYLLSVLCIMAYAVIKRMEKKWIETDFWIFCVRMQ